MMHNATQSNTTITTHCSTSTKLLLSGTGDSSVTRRTSFKLQQCCHYFVSNPCSRTSGLGTTVLMCWISKVSELTHVKLMEFCCDNNTYSKGEVVYVCTIKACRGSRCTHIVQLIRYLGTIQRWVIIFMPWPLNPRKGNLLLTEQEAWWAPEPVWVF